MSPKPTFSASSIGGGRAKARSLPRGRRTIVAKLFQASLKARHSARRLEFSFVIKMRGRRIMLRQKKNFAHRTPTLLTKRNMEFGIGRAGDALPREKRSGASPRLWSREKFFAGFVRRWTLSPTSHKFTSSRRRSTGRG